MDVSVYDGRRYEFDAFVLDPARRLLACASEPVSLTPTQLDALIYLVVNVHRTVTRDELLDTIWPRRTVDAANVSQTIFTLRKALAAAGATGQLIATTPGSGYRFSSPVRVRAADDGSPSAMHPTAPAGRPVLLPAAGGRALAAAMILVAVAALAAGAWRWLSPAAPGRPSLVVVGDFENLAKDPQFDRTLGMATQIDLRQSPLISVLPEQKVEDTLALMNRPRDAALVSTVAREVCARNNAAAAVTGAIAQVGARYLMTLTATDCAEGGVIDAEKAEVERRDAVLPTLDGLVARLRNRLGESAASIRRFDAPLLQRHTPSLAALRAYSQAHYDVARGMRIDSLPLFQQAVTLDPRFVAAYSDMAAIYYDLHQNDQAIASIDKAYALRGDADEREKLTIEARYNLIVTRDVPEGLRIYQAWAQVYPDDATAWANLSNAENWVGRYGEAIVDGRRALAIDSSFEGAYVVLGRALLHAGRLDEAQAICSSAAARGVDGDDLHGVLYDIAIARDDGAAAARQLQWAHGKPGERSILTEAGQAAFGRGQVRLGMALFRRAGELGQNFGLGDIFAAPNARLLHDLGRDALAAESLAKVPAGYDSADYRFALAEIGDAGRADRLLAQDIRKAPSDTLLTQVYAAEQHAAEALRRREPAIAVAALETAEPYEMRTFDVPYLRGRAYLAAGDGQRAAIEFNKVLDNRGVESVSPLYQLAELGLARALRLQRNAPASRAAYERFFRDWRNADPGMPLLAAARAEYGSLRGA